MKTYEHDSTSSRQAIDLKPALYEEKKEIDFLFRARGTSINDMEIIAITPTASAEYKFRTYLEILMDIIKGQSKQLEFNSYYISYLLGQTDENEFVKISKRFIQKKKKIMLDQLKNKVFVVKHLTDRDVTPKDIAQYLMCDEEDVMKAFQLLT